MVFGWCGWLLVGVVGGFLVSQGFLVRVLGGVGVSVGVDVGVAVGKSI